MHQFNVLCTCVMVYHETEQLIHVHNPIKLAKTVGILQKYRNMCMFNKHQFICIH